MLIDLKCPSCAKIIYDVVVGEIHWRGMVMPGAKIYGTTCPHCKTLIDTQIVPLPRDTLEGFRRK